MRRLVCQCGGVIKGLVPTHCPHCGAKIVTVRRKVNWLGPLAVVLLFAAVMALMIWLAEGLQ